MSKIMTLLQKARLVRSKGIALTHQAQGYSANNRHTSLLTKSDIDPSQLSVEVIKSLEQVQLTLSMEEYLRKFFHMWSDDAELLTKILGMKTEFEQGLEDNPEPDDIWLSAWNERHQEYLEDKLASVSLIKKAKEGAELSLVEQFELIKARKDFEDGCRKHGMPLGAKEDTSADVDIKPVVKSSKKESTEDPSPSSSGATTKTTEEKPVDKVDVVKSAEFIELMKANELLQEQVKGMQASIASAQEIVKSAAAAQRAVAVEKAAGFSFVDEGNREIVADVIQDEKQKGLLAVLEKAASSLKEKDDLLAAKDLEIEQVKKSFADGKDLGANGELSDVAKGTQSAQDRLNAAIAKMNSQNKA